MWTIVFLCFVIFGGVLADFYNNQYCSGWKPQSTVDIQQTQGLWYVQEKILHHERTRFIRRGGICPNVYISEDPSFNVLSTTRNPLYNFDGTNIGTNYGSRYPHYTETNPMVPTGSVNDPYRTLNDPYQTLNDPDYIKKVYEKEIQTTYSNDHPRSSNLGYVGSMRFNPNFLTRYLRLHWDDWTSTEYRLKYNVTRPSLWFLMRIGGGSTPEYDTHNIQGIVQVTKAVGNHLVLTFCKNRGAGQQPELFTAILSRQPYFSDNEIMGVHTLLLDRGLETSAVEKLCNGVSGLKISPITLISGVFLILYVYFSKLSH